MALQNNHTCSAAHPVPFGPQTAGGGGARGGATGHQPADDVPPGGGSLQGAPHRPAHDAAVQLERLPLRPREHQAVGGEEQAHAHRPRRLVRQHARRLAHVLVRRPPGVAREAPRLANRCFLQFVLRTTFRDDDVRAKTTSLGVEPDATAASQEVCSNNRLLVRCWSRRRVSESEIIEL